MRTSYLIDKRNQTIYEKYAKLWGQGMREELIWPELEKEFYLEQGTLYRIILKESKKDIAAIDVDLTNK